MIDQPEMFGDDDLMRRALQQARAAFENDGLFEDIAAHIGRYPTDATALVLHTLYPQQFELADTVEDDLREAIENIIRAKAEYIHSPF